MLDSIRGSELDLKFYKKMCRMLLKDDEIAKIKLKSNYEDDDWIIPPFVLRAKEVSLPKVNGRAVMDREKEDRYLDIKEDRSTGDSESYSEGNH